MKNGERVMVYVGSGKYRVGILIIIGTTHYITDEVTGITYGPYFDIEIEPYNENDIKN